MKKPTFVSLEARLRMIKATADIEIQIARANCQLKKIRSAKSKAKAAMHGGAFMLSEKVERLAVFNQVERMAEFVLRSLRLNAFLIEDLLIAGRPATEALKITQRGQ